MHQFESPWSRLDCAVTATAPETLVNLEIA